MEGYEAQRVIADTAYDADDTRDLIEGMDAEAVIRPSENRIEEIPYSKKHYKERHKVEVLIGKIKQFRRVFSRFDKLDLCYLSFVFLAGALLWLR